MQAHSVPQLAGPAVNVLAPSRTSSEVQYVVLAALFLLAHLPLGLIMYRDSEVATSHGLVALAAGLVLALLSNRRPEYVAYAAAYLVGGEVLWRMTGAPIAWEFGKYAMVATMTGWMVAHGRLAGPPLVGIYFVLMLPSAAFTLMEESLGIARGYLSFTLSGPLAVMIAVWFFSQARLSTTQRRTVFVALLGPLLSIAAVAFTATLLSPEIVFGTESNLQASGGFGPNQVSAALGLGALVALFGLTEERAPWVFKIMMLGCALLLTIQCAFTFSRGGLWNAGAAALIGSLQLLRDSRTRIKMLAGAATLAVLGVSVLFPALDTFTDGAFSRRFLDFDLTNREQIMAADIQIWQEHPVLGVGPGRANIFREAYFMRVASHAEYTRMLAEHGVLGLFSLIALCALIFRAMTRPGEARDKGVATALIAWSFLFMFSYGMRLAAPAFVIGFALMPIDASRYLARVSDYRSAVRRLVTPYGVTLMPVRHSSRGARR